MTQATGAARFNRREASVKQYTVVINGLEHTVQGTEDEIKVLFPDAKVLSSAAVEDKAVKSADNKRKS